MRGGARARLEAVLTKHAGQSKNVYRGAAVLRAGTLLETNVGAALL